MSVMPHDLMETSHMAALDGDDPGSFVGAIDDPFG
jgi:hypothetical protein